MMEDDYAPYVAGDSDCDDNHFVHPVEETQPPAPDEWRERVRMNMDMMAQQRPAMNGYGALERNEFRLTSLQSLEQRLTELNEGVINLQRQLQLFITSIGNHAQRLEVITVPLQETSMGASGPSMMADGRQVLFSEARQCSPAEIRSCTRQELGKKLTRLEEEMSQLLHKPASETERTRFHSIQSSCIQWHHSGLIIIKSSCALTRVLTLRPSVMGIVWNIQMRQLEENHFRIEENAAPRAIIVYSSPVVCPNCRCHIQLGAHIEMQTNSTGELEAVLLRQVDIVRVPESTCDRFLRLQRAREHGFCKPLTYYILVKVHMEGHRENREAMYWKITL